MIYEKLTLWHCGLSSHLSFVFHFSGFSFQNESKKPVIGKRYFNYVKLEDIVANYPHRKNLPDEEISEG